MTAPRYARCESDLERAELLAQIGTDDAIRQAMALAAQVRSQAARAGRDLEPSPWGDGAWARWSVLMTRASLLMLRHGGGIARVRKTPPPAPAGADSERGGAARSGVRARASSVAYAMLVVEPDASVRAALVEEACSIGMPLVAVGHPDEAAAMRTSDHPRLIACHFPMEGAVELADLLHRERFPVLITTEDVLEAIATFGFDIPILPKPLRLVDLLEHAQEIASTTALARDRDPARRAPRRRIVEVAARPGRRDRRRE